MPFSQGGVVIRLNEMDNCYLLDRQGLPLCMGPSATRPRHTGAYLLSCAAFCPFFSSACFLGLFTFFLPLVPTSIPPFLNLWEEIALSFFRHGVGLDGAGYVNHARSLHSRHWLRQSSREEATTSRWQRRMSSEVSSMLKVSGALASRSRLLKGQRREGSRERLEPSDVRLTLGPFGRGYAHDNQWCMPCCSSRQAPRSVPSTRGTDIAYSCMLRWWPGDLPSTLQDRR